MVRDTHTTGKRRRRELLASAMYMKWCVCVCVHLKWAKYSKGEPLLYPLYILSLAVCVLRERCCLLRTYLLFYLLFSFYFINSPFSSSSSSKKERESCWEAKEIHGCISDRQKSMLCVGLTAVHHYYKYFYNKGECAWPIHRQMNCAALGGDSFYSSTIVGRNLKKQWKGRT